MSKPVKLSEIIDGMEAQTDERRSYLNRQTGEIAGISDEEFRAAEKGKSLGEYPEWQKEFIQTAQEILEDEEGKFVALPSGSDIDE